MVLKDKMFLKKTIEKDDVNDGLEERTRGPTNARIWFWVFEDGLEMALRI